MPFMSVNSFAGLGIESSRGTASSNIKWIPVMSPQITPQQTFLRDEAYRGSPVALYNQVLGVRHDEYDVKGYAFADTFPLIAKAALGYEAIVGASAPYTHTVSLVNNTTGSQPPSVTVQDFDGSGTFQMLASQLGDLKITFGAEQALEWEAKFMANPFTVITNPSTSFSTEVFVPSWDVVATIGGSVVPVLVSGDLTISRSTAPIFTAQGTNAPYRNFAGPIEVKGTMKFIVENNDPIIYGSALATTTSSTAALSQTTTQTITLASVTGFNAGGGVGQIFHGGVWYSFNYASVSASTLTGVQLINGPGFTTSSGDAVTVGSYALNDNNVAVSLVFTDPVSGHQITVQMSSVQFMDPKRDRSKAFVEVDAAFEAAANTTDAVVGAGGGYSPIKIIATNAVSAVY